MDSWKIIFLYGGFFLIINKSCCSVFFYWQFLHYWLMQMSDISPIKNLYVAEIFFFFDQKSFSGPYWLWKNHVLYKLETLLGISQKKKKGQSHADALGLDCQIWIIVPYLYMYMFTFLMKLQFYSLRLFHHLLVTDLWKICELAPSFTLLYILWIFSCLICKHKNKLR